MADSPRRAGGRPPTVGYYICQDTRWTNKKKENKKCKGAAEKLREKRLKSLEADAAKCFKMTNYSFIHSLPVSHLSLMSLKALGAERAAQ